MNKLSLYYHYHSFSAASVFIHLNATSTHLFTGSCSIALKLQESRYNNEITTLYHKLVNFTFRHVKFFFPGLLNTKSLHLWASSQYMLINGKQTCLTLWIWIRVVCWTLAVWLQSHAPQKGGRTPESERETAGDRLSFLHTDTLKVSQKSVIECTACHFPVSYMMCGWKADVELCGLTALSWPSSPPFCLKICPVVWPRQEIVLPLYLKWDLWDSSLFTWHATPSLNYIEITLGFLAR